MIATLKGSGTRSRRLEPRQAASVGEDEGHLHVDPIGRDLAVLDDDLLLLNPGALDVLQRLGSAGYPLLDRVLKALVRRRGDFGDTGDGHGFLPWSVERSPYKPRAPPRL